VATPRRRPHDRPNRPDRTVQPPAKPPVTGGGGFGGDGGLPLWAMVLGGWGVLLTVAGLATLARRGTKRAR
jgi:hypothetical protein